MTILLWSLSNSQLINLFVFFLFISGIPHFPLLEQLSPRKCQSRSLIDTKSSSLFIPFYIVSNFFFLSFPLPHFFLRIFRQASCPSGERRSPLLHNLYVCLPNPCVRVGACFYSWQLRFERATRSLATFVRSHRSAPLCYVCFTRSLAPFTGSLTHFAPSL